MQAVAEPAGLPAARWQEFRASGDPRALLPRPDHLLATIHVYHPLVFAFGVGGLLLCSRTIQWMALIASGISFASFMLYPAPWTAMSAYPLLYIGAGVGCCVVGAAVGRFVRAGHVVATGLAIYLAATTNLDLAGDHTYLLSWWRIYYPPPLF
jgi:hypothetical protein